MATVQSVVCDECGRVKGDANHWFKVWMGVDNRLVATAVIECIGSDPGIKDVCSQQCMISLFQRWLDTGSVDKPQMVHPDPVEVAEVEDEEAESK